MVLNEKFETIHLIDTYKSMIWTDRYNKAGDFELYTEVSGEVLKYVFKDQYLTIKESDRTMIVSNIEITSDRELGNLIKITGYSLEKILDRRIVWGLRNLNTNLQNGIKTLLNESFISPTDSKRKISNFVFQEVSNSQITNIKIDKQYTGSNIYEVITELCIDNDVGFKLILNSNNQFVFSLYTGVDRSYDNTQNPYVIFSPSFENLVNSNYYDTNIDLKTVTLVAGEDAGSNRRYVTYNVTNDTGLHRREMFTDARDIQSEYYDDNNEKHVLTDAEYNKALADRGKERISEYTEITAFEGEVEYRNSFIYKEDYYLGDIVQIENEYGLGGTARIVEVVTAHDDSNGFSVYPTFQMIDKNK